MDEVRDDVKVKCVEVMDVGVEVMDEVEVEEKHPGPKTRSALRQLLRQLLR